MSLLTIWTMTALLLLLVMATFGFESTREIKTELLDICRGLKHPPPSRAVFSCSPSSEMKTVVFRSLYITPFHTPLGRGKDGRGSSGIRESKERQRDGRESHLGG
jgi:hypothetical protein